MATGDKGLQLHASHRNKSRTSWKQISSVQMNILYIFNPQNHYNMNIKQKLLQPART